MEKVKIVLDADVLIHFAKAQRLSMLPEILPGYEHIVLSTVYDEVRNPIRMQLDNQINLLKNIKREDFKPTADMKYEYARLQSRFGRGESACMAYCRFTHNVIGSSNLRDIRTYCDEHEITYLTTIDFLYYAYIHKLMTVEECNEFIKTVNANNSRLPEVDISQYTPKSSLY